MAEKVETKYVTGSFEHLRESIVAAIRVAGFFGGDFSVTNTLADCMTACTYGVYGSRAAQWRVPYTVDAAGAIKLGAPEQITIDEVITPVAPAIEDVVASDDGGEYSDDDVAGKAGDGLYYKAVDFEVKAVTDSTINGVKGWTFEGYASVWDVVDREGDITVKGCFARSLSEFGLPITKYEHGPTIGKYLEAKEDDHGLWLKGFVPEDPATELVHKLMKIGAVAKMSIGWRPYPGGMTKRADGVRELRAVMLPEASPVGVPMLPATEITSVKAATGALPDAKFDERVEAATAALNEAVADAGALVSRRTAQDRAPSAKSLDAVAALAVASGDAMLGLLHVEAKAGRALSGVRKRHLADLAKAVGAILASLPDGERKEIEALIDDAGGEATDTGGGKAAPNAAVAVGAARRREAELYELKLARYAPQAPVLDSHGVTP